MSEQKNKVGRPLKFQSVEELQTQIDSYFQNTPKEEWTVTGLCLALDTYRDVLIRYGKKDEFYNTIKRSKEKVHNQYEISLRKHGRSGDIFALKNFGWRDKSEVEQSGSVNVMGTILKDGKPFELDIGEPVDELPTTENT
ncbi:MAG: hypothetical protein CMB80_02995 [Flammeovirgaceae bacterium]|nr:hypothetical protein [Flammeovirgaceae bacterium]|tara:strand:+ start:30 stop:449 length:420 start_codon:yes stop_codon:yes gene_type:complete